MIRLHAISTAPIAGQKPGTSGLRKKVAHVLSNANYIENFVQATFDVVKSHPDTKAVFASGCALMVGGDGRYHNDVAIQLILKIAAANGVKVVVVGVGGLTSTPAVSLLIREYDSSIAHGSQIGGSTPGAVPMIGGFILTASHNPGGPDGDFGIKYNVASGGPAPAGITDAIYERTLSISSYSVAEIGDVALGVVGAPSTFALESGGSFAVEIVDTAPIYTAKMATIFDLAKLRALVAEPGFTMVFDGMHGVAGPYAVDLLQETLGVPADCLLRCTPLADFGGCHPDPNQKYAPELMERAGLKESGGATAAPLVQFGGACDGDADRNMVVGERFFVTPSDSVAIIAKNAAAAIPFFAGGVKGLSRSMPTSGALDLVAASLGLCEAGDPRFFVVPTGWKYFGNLMDSGVLGKTDYTPFICGEESFGTGSSHVREKDGLWAILAWLSVLSEHRASAMGGTGVPSVKDVVFAHWREFGRNFYQRHDYEGVETEKGAAFFANLTSLVAGVDAAYDAAEFRAIPGTKISVTGSIFTYTDPVDGSVANNQGWVFKTPEGDRIIFRKSGTGSSGITVRLYMEKYMAWDEASGTGDMDTDAAVASLVDAAEKLANIVALTGRSEPNVRT